MIGEMGEQLWKRMMDSERDRSKEWEEHSEEIMEAGAQDRAGRGAATELPQPDDGGIGHARCRFASEDEQKVLKKVYIAKGAIDVVKQVLWPILIRRTGKSRDPNGNTVLELPPYQTFIVWSPFSPRELEVMAELNAEHAHMEGHRSK
jgi:hypothetical protein